MKTIIKKDFLGKWGAKTLIPIGDTGYTLSVMSHKAQRGISTYCQALIIEQKEGYKTETFVVYQDYRATISTFPDVKRVSPNSLQKCHEISLEKIDYYVNKAISFYEKEALSTSY